MSSPAFLRCLLSALTASCALGMAPAGAAASEGGLYIAADGFSFNDAAERGLAQNPGGRRFFVLALPPESAALSTRASRAQAALRNRVLAANGVLLVCQRDIDNGRVPRADLAAGVVAVRGWPPQGSNALPAGQRYFADEDRSQLPAANEALRRLRTACA